MAKSNKKQTAEIKKFDLERKNKKNCDHQWYFISRDEEKNKIVRDILQDKLEKFLHCHLKIQQI